MIDPREPVATRDNAPIVYGAGTWRAAAAEMRDFDASTRAILALPHKPGCWGPVPLTVISARGDQKTTAHHADVARLSTLGRHIVAPTSDHYLHLAQPALVRAEIDRLTRSTV
jgi:pimeloyl-ACP methyl ester carboxylesterase